MVTTKIDPVRVSPLNLSNAELEEIEAMSERGVLPKDWIERHFDAVQKNVFGADHKVDRDGNPIEQGVGSPGNQTQQSIDAYKRFGKDEPEFKAHLDRMEKEKVASQNKNPTDQKTRWLKRRRP